MLTKSFFSNSFCSYEAVMQLPATKQLAVVLLLPVPGVTIFHLASVACINATLQGENPHSELLPHLMGKAGPTGYGSSTTAEQVAAGWDGTGKVSE